MVQVYHQNVLYTYFTSITLWCVEDVVLDICVSVMTITSFVHLSHVTGANWQYLLTTANISLYSELLVISAVDVVRMHGIFADFWLIYLHCCCLECVRSDNVSCDTNVICLSVTCHCQPTVFADSWQHSTDIVATVVNCCYLMLMAWVCKKWQRVLWHQHCLSVTCHCQLTVFADSWQHLTDISSLLLLTVFISYWWRECVRSDSVSCDTNVICLSVTCYCQPTVFADSWQHFDWYIVAVIGCYLILLYLWSKCAAVIGSNRVMWCKLIWGIDRFTSLPVNTSITWSNYWLIEVLTDRGIDR